MDGLSAPMLSIMVIRRMGRMICPATQLDQGTNSMSGGGCSP
jgi:hypothetical protein